MKMAVLSSEGLRKAVAEFRNSLLAASPKRGQDQETFKGPDMESIDMDKQLKQLQTFIQENPGTVRDEV
jgi:hypothetical protein